MTDFTQEKATDLRIGENHVNQSLMYSNEGYSILQVRDKNDKVSLGSDEARPEHCGAVEINTNLQSRNELYE